MTNRPQPFRPSKPAPQQARLVRLRGDELRRSTGEGSAPQFTVVVTSLNGAKVLRPCLATALANRGVTFEVIVVDNGSTDATAEIARSFPQVKLIQAGRNLGFAGGNNLGIVAARGEFIVLLNDDTEAPPDWLASIARGFARDERIGAVGCKLVYPTAQPHTDPGNRVLQHAGGILLPNANTLHTGMAEPDRGQYDTPRECDYVTGAALAMRREALEEVGLLDPEFFPIYFEEVELQTRLRHAGWKILYEPSAWLVHHESQSQGAGSAQFVYRYTFGRMRYLALHGCPGGRWRALRAELPWLWNITRAGRLGPVLRAYWAGLRNWSHWRAERHERPNLPRL